MHRIAAFTLKVWAQEVSEAQKIIAQIANGKLQSLRISCQWKRPRKRVSNIDELYNTQSEHKGHNKENHQDSFLSRTNLLEASNIPYWTETELRQLDQARHPVFRWLQCGKMYHALYMALFTDIAASQARNYFHQKGHTKLHKGEKNS